MVIAELQKQFYNNAQDPSMYFWRDNHGHEVDCLLDYGTKLIPVEIKSSKTIKKDFFLGLKYWCDLAQISPSEGYIVYGGDDFEKRSMGNIISWKYAADIIPIKSS